MDIWKAGDDVMNTVKDLVANHHPHLALYVNEIAVVIKEKAAKVGDVEIIGKTAKAPSLLEVLSPETPVKFVITLAADAWQELDDKQRLALLDHHLCGCGVEETKSGVTKFFVKPYDVAFFRGEMERHGVWRTSGAPPTPNLIEDLFGKD
jgi:hypothetical protein